MNASREFRPGDLIETTHVTYMYDTTGRRDVGLFFRGIVLAVVSFEHPRPHMLVLTLEGKVGWIWSHAVDRTP